MNFVMLHQTKFSRHSATQPQVVEIDLGGLRRGYSAGRSRTNPQPTLNTRPSTGENYSEKGARLSMNNEGDIIVPVIILSIV